MQKDDVIEFLEKIDSHLQSKFADKLAKKKFDLKIFGKSALMLAGLKDSVGTNDIDILKVDGQASSGANPEIIKSLEDEFGRLRIKVHGYYLEFVSSAIVFLSQKPAWVAIEPKFQRLAVSYLDPNHVIASKLFSTFSNTPRKQDKQDIRAALDQKLVALQEVGKIADNIFDFHSMDSRSDRFPEVYAYLTEELMADYGNVDLKYRPDEL